MEERHFKLLAFSAQSVFYLDVLSNLRVRAGWFFKGVESEELIVPYVITCAAALECTLNDCLIKFFNGTKHLEAQLDGYLSMTLKGKLINVVPVVTAQRFVINQEHKVYQHLVELIRIRNKLVHNRSSVIEEHTATLRFDEKGEPSISVSEGFDIDGEAEHDYTFGIPGDVGRFHDAVEAFYNKFMQEWDPDDFKGNDLVIPAEIPPSITTFRIKDE